MDVAALVDSIIRKQTEGTATAPSTLTDTPGVPWSDAARACAVRLVEAQMATLAGDLAAFARHAKRSTIGTDDVRLALRRTPSLADRVSGRVAEEALGRKRAGVLPEPQ